MNKSLPILKNKSFSIDNYEIGLHNNITTIIEEQMANLSFQGAGGWINFNRYRSVSTPIDIIWVLDKNGTQEYVGVYDPLASGISLELNISSLPKDSLDKEFAIIPFHIAILMYSLIGAVTIVTTVQFVLYFYYREHKMIKASSPYLSLLMFGGCYLLLLASISQITNASFFNVVTQQVYIALWCVNKVATLNGLGLILVTLCIKLLRVYRIFSSKLQRDLGKFWGNFSLFLAILFLTISPNVIIAPLLAFHSDTYSTYTVASKRDDRVITEVHIELKTTYFFIIDGLIMLYVFVFSLFTVCLALRTRKIKYRNFKDTKKINVFVALQLFTQILIQPLYLVFILQGNEPLANIALVICLLIITSATQFILFLPKILPVFLSIYIKNNQLNLLTLSNNIVVFSNI